MRTTSGERLLREIMRSRRARLAGAAFWRGMIEDTEDEVRASALGLPSVTAPVDDRRTTDGAGNWADRRTTDASTEA